MQRKITDNYLTLLRDFYTPGTKVVLVKMDDKQAPPIGTVGEVIHVDDIGTIHVKWENGSTLGVVPGADKIKAVDKVITVCYGNRRVWQKREDAVAFFQDCIQNSEGSERDRYTNVYMALLSGLGVCRDR